MNALSGWRARIYVTVVVCVWLVLPLPRAGAVADDLFNRYFANVLDGPPCFARTYDATYLDAHAGQHVRSIEVDLARTNADGTPNSPERFQLGFGLMLRTGSEWYGQAASCAANDADFECFLEGDGGVFRLTPAENGELRLDTGENGIALESGTATIDLSGKAGADRVFDLPPSKDECAAAAAFFEGGAD